VLHRILTFQHTAFQSSLLSVVRARPAHSRFLSTDKNRSKSSKRTRHHALHAHLPSGFSGRMKQHGLNADRSFKIESTSKTFLRAATPPSTLVFKSETILLNTSGHTAFHSKAFCPRVRSAKQECCQMLKIDRSGPGFRRQCQNVWHPGLSRKFLADAFASIKTLSGVLFIYIGVSKTRPAWVFCAARDAFWEFQTINLYVIYFIHRCLKVLGQLINKFLSNERREGWK